VTAGTIRDLTAAISKLSPQQDRLLHSALISRGLTYLLSNQPGKARNDFEHSSRLGTSVWSVLGLVLVRAANGETAAAQQALRKLLRGIQRPMFATLPRTRANLQLADRLVALLPRHPLTYAERGNVHFKLGNRNGAIRDFERGLAHCTGVHAQYATAIKQALAKAQDLPRSDK